MSTCKRMWTDREIRSMADESAKIRIEAGKTENAKPVYFHPIVLNDNALHISLSCIILDNDPNPCDSYAKFKTKVTNMAIAIDDTARIIMSGSIENGEHGMKIASVLDVSKTGVLKVYGYDTDGNFNAITITDYAISDSYDNVIKIN